MAISDKLTYLNDTKTQLKDMINYGLDTGEKITSETTFRNYVKSLFDAFIKTMTYPDVLYNNLPKVTGEGTSLTLNDTVYAPMRVDLSPSALEQGANPSPDSPQQIHTVSGENNIVIKNKNLAYMKDGTYTFQNNTGVISDNILTLNSGSAGSNTYISLANGYYQQWAPISNISDINDMNLTSNGGDYVASIYTNKTYSGTVQFYVFTSSGRNFAKRFDSATDTTLSFTLNDDEHVKDIGIWTSSSNVFEDYQIKVQLEKNSSASTYEPHQEQTYPLSLSDLEYCKIGDYEDGFIRNSGKNLWNEQWENGYYNRTTGAKGSGNNYLRCDDYIPIQPNTTIYFTKPSEFLNYAVIFYDSSKTITGTIPTPTETQSKSFTAPANAYYFTFYLDAGSGTATYHNNIMINEGTTVLPYEPYGSGEWYLKKNVGKVVLDNTLSNVGTTAFNNVYAIYSNTIGITYLVGGFCDNFKFNTDSRITDNTTANDYLSDNQMALRLGNDSARDRLYIKSTNFASADELKQYFNNNPTSVYYVLATPTYTLLSDTLQTQLEAIWRANSYEGQTNVSQTNNDLPFVIKLSAIRDYE